MTYETRIRSLRQRIKAKEHQIDALKKKEGRSRKTWTKAYHDFMKAATELTKLKQHGTKREQKLHARIVGWPKRTGELTGERDRFRRDIEATRAELTSLGTELALLLEQRTNDTRATDEIVAQVFELNTAVVRASVAREDCLNRHVFPRLIDEKGRLCSQVSFVSGDGLRKVVAMVNTMTIVRGDTAAAAMNEIQRFFDRFKPSAEMDANTRALYELTRQLLVEKTSFKVGPDLYRFLAMELDPDIFPELTEAQLLLRQSIRSEKTNSYIRLYGRRSRTENWEVVRQS